MEGCRIYVCRTFYGRNRDKCLSFENKEYYDKWKKLNSDLIGQTTLVPVCNKIAAFDKAYLAYQNGKIIQPEVKKWTPEDPIRLYLFGW
jgi:hypothetical protein